MIRRLEIANYKVIRRLPLDLGEFQVLVGPNGSGKSTVMDVFVFLSDLLQVGIREAVESRAESLQELTWKMQGGSLEFAVELELPDSVSGGEYKACRYEIALADSTDGQGIFVQAENLFLLPRLSVPPARRRSFFPAEPKELTPIVRSRSPAGWRKVFRKTAKKRYEYQSENTNWHFPYEVIRDTTGLRNLPADEKLFPASLTLRRLLGEDVHFVQLDIRKMRRPCPPGAKEELDPDGSNFVKAILALKKKDPQQFDHWTRHVLSFLPEFRAISVRQREEDRHFVLELETTTGTAVPVWLLSDGTIRFLALTLLAYVPGKNGVVLIEEPENGMHPGALEGVRQSLSSAYDRQVLVATHSPLFVAGTEPEQLLCFGKTETGTIDVVRGTQHPRLKDWKRSVDLGTLFASGVLD